MSPPCRTKARARATDPFFDPHADRPTATIAGRSRWLKDSPRGRAAIAAIAAGVERFSWRRRDLARQIISDIYTGFLEGGRIEHTDLVALGDLLDGDWTGENGPLSHLRKLQRRALGASEWKAKRRVVYLPFLDPPVRAAESDAEARDDLRALAVLWRAALGQLSVDERATVFAYLQTGSIQAAADMRNVAWSTMNYRLHKAMGRLNSYLGQGREFDLSRYKGVIKHLRTETAEEWQGICQAIEDEAGSTATHS